MSTITSKSPNVSDTTNKDGTTNTSVTITESNSGTTTATTSTPTTAPPGVTTVSVNATGKGYIHITTDNDGTSHAGTINTGITDTGNGTIKNTADNDGATNVGIIDSGTGHILNTVDNDSSANVSLTENGSGSGFITSVVDHDGGSNGLGSGNTMVTISSGSGLVRSVVENDSAKGETIVTITDDGSGLSQEIRSVVDHDGNTIIVDSGTSREKIVASHDKNVFLNLQNSTGADRVVLDNNASNIVDAGVGHDTIVAQGGATSKTQAVDNFIYEGALNATDGGQKSTFSAGNGSDDTLIIKMSPAEYTSYQSEAGALSTYLTTHDSHIKNGQDTNTSSYTFNSLPLTISGFENILIEQVGAQNTVQLQGKEGSTPISLASAFSVVPGSQTDDTITLSGVPTGASFTEGMNDGNGNWTFTLGELSTLGFVPGTFSGTVDLSLATPDVTAAFYSSPLISITIAPTLLGSAPTNLYVTNLGSNNVSVINSTTNNGVTTIPVGNSPYDSVFDPSNSELYVTNSKANTVTVFNSTANSISATIPVVSSPEAIAYDPNNSDIYVANSAINLVSVINSTTNGVTTIPVAGDPTGFAYDPTNTYMYVANANDTVSVINSAPNGISVVGSPIELASSPVNVQSSVIAYDPFNNDIYVANSLGILSIIGGGGATSLNENKVIISFSVGVRADAIAYDSGNHYIYVANSAGNTLSGINTTNGVTSGVTSITVGSQGSHPTALAYDSSNNDMYVANSDGTVSVIGANNMSVLPTPISVGLDPTAITYDASNNDIYVVNSGSNTVSVIDGKTNTVTATLTVGTDPTSITGDAPAPLNDAVITNLPNGSTLDGGGNNTADFSQLAIPANDLLDINLVTGQASLMNAGSQIGQADTLLNFNNVTGSNNAPGGELITVGNLTGTINGGTSTNADNIIDLSELNGNIDLTANIPHWSNIEAINLGSSTALTINAADVQQLSPNGQLEITASSATGDSVTLEGAWQSTNQTVTLPNATGVHTYNVYTLATSAGTETLLVDEHVHAKVHG